MLSKLTKLNIAKNRILRNIQPINRNTKISLNECNQRINYNTLKSKLNLPETRNSAVDGYGISYVVKDDLFSFHISSYKISKETDSLLFNKVLEESLDFIMGILEDINT